VASVAEAPLCWGWKRLQRPWRFRDGVLEEPSVPLESSAHGEVELRGHCCKDLPLPGRPPCTKGSRSLSRDLAGRRKTSAARGSQEHHCRQQSGLKWSHTSHSQTKTCKYISSLVKIKTQYEGVGIFHCNYLPFSPVEALLNTCHLLALLQHSFTSVFPGYLS